MPKPNNIVIASNHEMEIGQSFMLEGFRVGVIAEITADEFFESWQINREAKGKQGRARVSGETLIEEPAEFPDLDQIYFYALMVIPE